MIEAIKLWNEPNNISHWDFEPGPRLERVRPHDRLAAQAVREAAPGLRRVLGGLSPIDPEFADAAGPPRAAGAPGRGRPARLPPGLESLADQQWPDKIAEIEAVTGLPIWVTEVGVSTFGADEVQVFGLQRTAELLLGRVERVYWYSLFDLPPTWEATARNKEAEGSSYYRHFYMGLIRADGTPKPAADHFRAEWAWSSGSTSRTPASTSPWTG